MAKHRPYDPEKDDQKVKELNKAIKHLTSEVNRLNRAHKSGKVEQDAERLRKQANKGVFKTPKR